MVENFGGLFRNKVLGGLGYKPERDGLEYFRLRDGAEGHKIGRGGLGHRMGRVGLGHMTEFQEDEEARNHREREWDRSRDSLTPFSFRRMLLGILSKKGCLHTKEIIRKNY